MPLTQFIKFSSLDPIGLVLVSTDTITAIAPTVEPDQCRLVTSHGEYLVEGTMQHFIECLQSWFGQEWSAIQDTSDETLSK